MSHGPATEWGKDPAAPIKARVGAWLFAIYTVIYAAFVLVNVLAPQVMDTVIAGQTLATVYGMGLIVLALIMGIYYNRSCSQAEDRLAEKKEG